MKRALIACLLLFLPLAAAPAHADDAADQDLVEPVNKAINRGIKFLRDKYDDGNWENSGYPGHGGAVTALAVLALLNAGVSVDDPAVHGGLAYLRDKELTQTYDVSLQTMALALARQPKDLEKIRKNVQWLINARVVDGGKMKGWSYDDRRRDTDNSNTQYALLGLHEGHWAGAKVDSTIWESILNFYKDTRNRDGGWGYKIGAGSSRTMSTAGLCGLLIASNNMRSTRKECVPDRCGNYDEDRDLAKALDFVGLTMLQNDSIERNDQTFYYLYGLERAGRLSGRRFIGGHDWYRRGCSYLVKAQGADGSWAGGGIDSKMVSTCFALLFLSKGRTPILITKLAYGSGRSEDWNNDRNDAKNLVDFCSRSMFKGTPLAWQIFDVRQDKDLTKDRIRELTAELLQSPIVYFTGHDEPRVEGGVVQLLREYVNNGGFIMAEACCGREEFRNGFPKLMKEMFPDNPLEPLPEDHPVWTASGRFASRPSQFELEGIRLGCKWVVIYSKGKLRDRPNSLCCWWEVNQYEVDRGKDAFELGANIVAYATGLEPPKQRGTKFNVPQDVADKPPRGALAVAQLKHEGDWHPAPKAMRNLMLETANEGIDVALKTQELSLDAKDLIDYKFLYMHGRREFQFAAKDLDDLRFNLKEGGALLLADACCGSAAFDKSFRKFVADLFPDKKLEFIPLTDDLYSKELNGTAITQVRCRRPNADGTPDRAYRAVDPYLEGIKIDGRWVVIYSKYDIGCALENNKASDCLGHDHDSAVRLGKAAVYYVLKR